MVPSSLPRRWRPHFHSSCTATPSLWATVIMLAIATASHSSVESYEPCAGDTEVAICAQ
jgi:hypothetical protein